MSRSSVDLPNVDPPGVELAIATPSDLPLLFDWMRQLRDADPMETESLVPPDVSQRAMTQLLAEESAGRVFLIRAGGQSVGYAVLVFSFSVEFGGRTAFIDELFLTAGSRGQGIARRAVDLLTTHARSLGVNNLLLEVTATNVPAQRLYTAAGFVQRKYDLMTKWIGRGMMNDER